MLLGVRSDADGEAAGVVAQPVVLAEPDRAAVDLEVAMQYNDSYDEKIFSFANNINTVDGGTHLSGFRSALTRTINNLANGVSYVFTVLAANAAGQGPASKAGTARCWRSSPRMPWR